jgi:hypothetical protein
VTDWFKTTQASLKEQYGRAVPSLAFVHIPVYAMAAFQSTGIDPKKEPGINDDNPLAMQGVDDSGNYDGSDVPFMSALLQTQGLMAVFSGHDHGDDWCENWKTKLPGMSLTGDGLFLCFGRHSGYGGYGQWTQGSRQIKLSMDTLGEEVQSWIRLEDGSISGSVVLNSTYGTDDYSKLAENLSFMVRKLPIRPNRVSAHESGLGSVESNGE